MVIEFVEELLVSEIAILVLDIDGVVEFRLPSIEALKFGAF